MKRFLQFLMSSSSYLLRFSVLFLMFFPGLLFSQDKVVLDSLHVQLEHSKEDNVKVKTLWELSYYYLKSDLTKSLDYSFQALEVANEIDDRFFVASSYAKLGNVFLLIGIHNEALKNFLKSLEIFEDAGDKVQFYLVLIKLGDVYHSTGDYDKALEYYFEALSVYNVSSGMGKSAMEEKVIGLYNNIGSTYSANKEHETASQYFSNALNLAKKKNDLYNLGVIYNNFGRLASILNKKNEAYSYFRLAIEFGKKEYNLQTLTTANIYLANYYLGIGNEDKALEAAEKANVYAEEYGSKSFQQYISLLFFQIYQEKKQYEKAMNAHIHFKEISDSLQKENNLKEQIALQFQYEYDKKEKIREAEQQKRELRYFLVISILTLGVIITGLLYSLLKNRTRRIQLEKKQLSLEKEKLEKDLEVKNKELTTNVMYLLKKNETISNISTKLLNFKNRVKPDNRGALQVIIMELHGVVDTEVWEEFEYRFQQVHTMFYAVLQEKFPDLTPGDKKLAAFLRLNMTTKEIASILSISVNSVEKARYRIRKKMGIANQDVNLVNYLSDLS